MLYYPPGRFRNVSWGGWLSRDPIGEAGGINLYGFAANDPVSRIDPLGLWVISRFGAPRATATASEGDTIDSLAWILRLDKEDYQKWLRDMNGNRVTSDEVHPCWSFLVPNTVYVDKGMKQWRDIGPINIISVLDSVADAMAKKYRREGFHVVKSGGTLFGIKASEIMDHLNSDTIYEYWFFGHGGDGYINTAGFWGPGNEGVAPSRYTDYGIARMILFACESVMQISHTDPEGQGVNYVVTPWEANVSTRGEVLGFKVEVSGLDLLTKDPSEYLGRYRGTNNRP